MVRTSSPSSRFLPTALALGLLLAAGTAWGEPRGDGMDFGPPSRPAPAPTQPGATGSSDAPGAKDDPVQREVEQLATWPDRVGVRAAESLLLRGPEVLPRLLDVLNAGESPQQPGAAWIVGHLGEPAHIQVILRAAAQRRPGSRADAFFEAAYALDAEKTKHWLFSFLTLNRPVFRQKAIEFLIDHVGAEDRRRVLNLLDADKPGVRIAGLRLLEPAGIEDAQPRMLQALADFAPEVARQASILLALRADEDLTRRLNDLAIEGTPRERAYATLALVEVARTRDTNPFERRTLVELGGRRGILHPERLTRGAAAVGLAYGALDSSDSALQNLLDRTVVDVLVDTVGGEHFRDFSSLVDPVFSALRRLAGLDLPSTAIAWASWWQTERDRFQARRPLSSFDPADLASAYLAYELVDAEGRRQKAVFRPEAGSVQDGDLVLRGDVFLALVGALETAGLFEGDTVAKPRADEHLLVILGVLNQTRRLAVPVSDERYPLLRMRFESMVDANRWQRYRDLDRWPDAQAWWKTNVDLLEEADPAARREMLRAAVVQSFDDLDDEVARGEAIDLLEDLLRQDEASGALTSAQVKDLVEGAAAAIAFGDVEERAVRFAIAQPSSAKVRRELVESLAARPEPGAQVLLAEMLAAGGSRAVRDSFGDPRPSMRAAAARAAQTLVDEARAREPASLPLLADAFRPGLEVLLKDSDPRVATRAAVTLHHLGEPGAVAELEKLYKAGDLGMRLVVADALGDVEANDAYPLLNLLLANERDAQSGPLRATALKALARTRHENTVSLLVFYLLNDADPGVQHAAGEALVDLGTEEARFAVVRALTEGQPDADRRARLVSVLGRFDGHVVTEVLTSYLEDAHAEVVQAAAFGLADHNVAATVPYLIEIARSGDPRAAEQAIRALENLSLKRYALAGHALVAEQYEAWYQAARITVAKEPDRVWFRDALRDRGYDVGPLGPYVAGEADPVGVPVLIRALRDEDPLVRRGAEIALERITGLSLGKVTRTTSLADAVRVADQWARWWNRVQEPSDDGR